MSQNLVTLAITDEQLAAALAGLQQVEAALPGLIAFEVGERRGLPLMGPRSEPFARQTLRVLEQNPGIVPPSHDELRRELGGRSAKTRRKEAAPA
jgi:hypothetical protein